MTVTIATAALVRDGRLLLAHRHPEREWYPDCWDLIGGHVEPGETPREAAIRECAEELGVAVLDPEPVMLPCDLPGLEMHHFLVTSWRGTPRNMAPDEHDGLKWFTADEIADLVLADPTARTPLQELASRA
ncbi:MAG: NUDIX domain-containing protein [Tetrasphaera sp.]